MLNFIYLILGLCVLGALVMTVYAFLKPTDDTHVCVDERSALKLEKIETDRAVFSFTVPMRNTSHYGCVCASLSAAGTVPRCHVLGPIGT